jgi:SAM-dependent methyltransferase
MAAVRRVMGERLMEEEPVRVAGAPSWREFERAGWQSRADAYHRFFAPICARMADPLLDAVGAGPGTRLLDACCGPGYVAGRGVHRGCVVNGIDIAESMVDLATALNPGAEFHVGDVEHLPFADHEFDAVVCNIGLHHLTDPARGVAELARVLRPGGRLALSVWDEQRSTLDIVRAAVLAVGPVAPEDLPRPPARPDYDRDEDLRPLFEPVGLRLESITPITFTQRYPDPEAVWAGWLGTAIRTGPLLAAQPAEVQAAARRVFDDMVAAHLEPDGSVVLPVGLVLVSASR